MHTKRLSGSHGVLDWRAVPGSWVGAMFNAGHPADVSASGDQITKKSTIYTPTSTPDLAPLLSLTLATSVFVAAMASDTLIPETRVLAIASHVRVTRAFVPKTRSTNAR